MTHVVNLSLSFLSKLIMHETVLHPLDKHKTQAVRSQTAASIFIHNILELSTLKRKLIQCVSIHCTVIMVHRLQLYCDRDLSTVRIARC